MPINRRDCADDLEVPGQELPQIPLPRKCPCQYPDVESATLGVADLGGPTAHERLTPADSRVAGIVALSYIY